MASMLIIALVLSTACGLRRVVEPAPPEDMQFGKANMDLLKDAGLRFQGQPISVAKVDAETGDGIAALIKLGPVIAPIYSVIDEPYIIKDAIQGYDMYKTDINMSKCSQVEATSLAKKYPTQEIPKAISQSALPKNSYYAKETKLSLEPTTDGWFAKNPTMGCDDNGECPVPAYLPAREKAEYDQKIPRIIWMTVSNAEMKAGPFHYNLMAQHFMQNPEYEWIVSNDTQSREFMNSDEVKESWSRAYNMSRNGAERADIWRYAVMYKYGGVYMDADMTAQKPLRKIIEQDADMAQQFLRKPKGRESTQFVLMYTPKHPIMEAVLDQIAFKFLSGQIGGLTNHLTGPGALSAAFATTHEFGAEMCKDDYHICGEMKQPTDPSYGKVQYFLGHYAKGRDLDCGKRWHKVDSCALMEARSKFKPWEAQKR
jgi:hypothetical protein